LTPSKESGVSPHGHRHAYGKRLSDGECSEKLIQICLHHSDIASQKVYTELSSKDIRSSLNDAVKKIEQKRSI
jgi:site-specific recombinase XerD